MKTAQQILQNVFGYPEFLSIQADVIAHVTNRRDALVVMPTGGGKSLCYQIPALMFEGLTVVVSPLISLMNDQLQQLRQNGVAAVQLNSSLEAGEYRRNIDLIKSATAKLLYVAPESLLKENLLQLLASIRVDCLAIDEAHCISEWGHDFRPEYRLIKDVRQKLPGVTCVALTATATHQVRQDIKQSLGFSEEAEFIAGFDRPNLFLQVEFKNNPYRQTLQIIRRHAGQPGIIYCATRKQVDQLTQALTEDGIAALPYHAGLADTDRHSHQSRFSRDDVQVMVATVAFGMGIDKSNIRFVIHYDLPKNIESYYQEIGRAGRDGMRADCLLLFSYGDIHKIKFMINKMDPARQRTANLLLTTMLRYVETDVCRRIVLLDYFGERYAKQECGMCDNCLSTQKETQDLTIPAQKFLSCIKRTGEIFGMEYIIDTLRGAKTQKILQRGHHNLTTYGIGMEYSKNQWRHLARRLLHEGFMIQEMQYGGVQLTPKAWELFRGQCAFHAWVPEDAPLADTQKNAASETKADLKHDTVLFELLRQKRKALADEAQVPPFVIFSDKSLIEMAACFPQSLQTLRKVHGVGEVKAQRYGDIFLQIIKNYCAENHIADHLKANTNATAPSQPRSGPKRRYEEVGEAYNSGQTIAQLMAQYQVKRTTIIDHLLNYWRKGNPMRSDDPLFTEAVDEQTQKAAFKAFDRLGYVALRPIYDALAESASYDDLHLLRLYYICTRVVWEEEHDEA